MPRTAVVSFEFPSPGGRMGGIGTFSLQWARLLRQAGGEVTLVLAPLWTPGVLTPGLRSLAASEGLGLEVLPIPRPAENRSPFLPALELSERIAEVIAPFDIAYFPDAGGLATVPLRAARTPGSRMPVCVTVLHGPGLWVRHANRRWKPEDFQPAIHFQEQYGVEQAHWLACPSAFIAGWVRERGWRLPDERVRVMGLPFLPDPALPQPESRRDPIRHLIYFGRCEPRKGFGMFAEALLEWRRADPVLAASIERVTFLGGAPDAHAPSVQQAFGALREQGFAIEQQDQLDQAAAFAFLSRHASQGLAVMPSRRDGDNFPYAVLESSLTGIRWIASRAGGIPEILGPEGEPCLFDPNPRALAACLGRYVAGSREDPGQPWARPYDWQAANQRWLRFHEEALGSRHTPRPVPPAARPTAHLDVCIPYFNKSATFAQTLDSLAAQTCRRFTVIAVDDGSTDPRAREVFDQMAARHASRGWTFFRTENNWVDAARNRAAAQGSGEYLLFLDADDVLPPHALDRLLACIEATGDHCLIPAIAGFRGLAPPLGASGQVNHASGQLNVEICRRILPLGPAPMAALEQPAVLGGPVWIVRRTAFEALAGFRETGEPDEDWEFLLRLALAGYRVEVLPEYLHFYRMDDPGSLSQQYRKDEAPTRLLHTYESALSRLGLEGAASLLWAHQSQRFQNHDWADVAARYEREVVLPGWLRPVRRLYRNLFPPTARLRLHSALLAPLSRWLAR